ncbi:MAG: Glutathionyl-hydroquinone reductase YqjG [Marinobacterium sp. xm-d-530]|nr:MAG: Glutathionyl-hydroquinone reductase YqjG [Marinobacterium sp. xm-d-530]
MGLLIDGQWHDQWYDTKSSNGKFVRTEAQYRHWITRDGSAGPTGDAGFRAEPGRYHLYVSLACPWAHRTLIVRALKGLQDQISFDVVHPLMLEHGWAFDSDFSAATGDRVNQKQFMHQIYTLCESDYTGRVTVPVLWDKQNQTIVSNESSEIIRMLNTGFNEIGATDLDLCPQSLQSEIDHWNQFIYEPVNNGVYKAGFATTQAAYDEAVVNLFEHLDRLEERLTSRRYLVGEQLTETDIRLFTTLIRFDPVYVQHFKCDRRRIAEYPALANYLRDIYQLPGVAETCDLDHIRHHYYRSHPTINPHGIISYGPEFDLMAQHGRENL